MSIHSYILQAVSRRLIKRHNLTQQQTVQHLRRVFNHAPAIPLLPRGVNIRKIDRPEFVGERVSVPHPKLTVLYFHGGAFVGGVTRTYHNLAARLAKRLNAEVFLATYPFAPEQPYPAAPNRCLEAYNYLLSLDKRPERIILAGDSAGGSLALTTLMQIRDQQIPQPRCAVLFSPATNAQPDEQQLQTQCPTDVMLSADLVKQIINLYLPEEKDRTHPYASPVNGDFAGLPPMMITASSDEILYTDAQQARNKAQAAGVQVEWLERSGVCHVWPIMVPFLPEANRDLAKVVRFIRHCRPCPREDSPSAPSLKENTHYQSAWTRALT